MMEEVRNLSCHLSVAKNNNNNKKKKVEKVIPCSDISSRH